MGRTACTEPQYLYKGALYLTFRKTGKYKEIPDISIPILTYFFYPLSVNFNLQVLICMELKLIKSIAFTHY